MSRAALESMIKGINRYSIIKRQMRGVTTPGQIYRKASFEAPHRVNLSKRAIKEQLVAMITDPTGLNLQTLSQSKIDKLTTIVFDNIVNALQRKGFKYDTPTSSFLVKGDKGANNYRKISEAFNEAFGGKKAYGPFFDFLIDQLSDEAQKTERDYVTAFKGKLKPEDLKGYGFDVGHIEANITSVFKAAVWNSLKEDFRDEKLDFRNNEEIAAELLTLEKEWEKILTTSVSSQVLQDYLISKKIISPGEDPRALLEGFFEHTIGFAKDIASGKAQAVLKLESKLKDQKSLEKIAREVVVSVMPEYGKANQDKGSKLEQSIIRQLEVIGASSEKRLSSILIDWLSGNSEIPGLPALPDQPGSLTIKEMIAKNLFETLTTGKSAPQKTNTTATQKASARVNKATPAKVSKPIALNLGKQNVPKLRAPKGQFTSLVNVVNLINMQLAERIRQNMGTPGLNYRTGRFAKSAKVLAGSMDKDGVVRLPYTYMKYPYQTFEPGFAQGSPARNPKSLITKSVREIAQKLVTSRLRIVRV